jgi:hypothetical protein
MGGAVFSAEARSDLRAEMVEVEGQEREKRREGLLDLMDNLIVSEIRE